MNNINKITITDDLFVSTKEVSTTSVFVKSVYICEKHGKRPGPAIEFKMPGAYHSAYCDLCLIDFLDANIGRMKIVVE